MNYFSYNLKQCKTIYVLVAICFSCGIALGITLNFTSGIGSFFLRSNDQQIFDFITNDVSLVNFVFSKEGNLFVAFLILFVFSLSFYSSFLCYAFFAYQGFIFAASCCNIISTYGLLGILNVAAFLIPINLVLFGIMAYFVSVALSRAVLAKRYGMGFKTSFVYKQYFWREICVSAVVGFVFVLLVSILFGIVLRGISFIVF